MYPTSRNALQTAVLFIAFNREDTSRQVLDSIREAKPPRIYVAIDGPREHVEGEGDRVRKTTDLIINGIDWDCEVFKLVRDHNLGCKYAVSEAITWFFEHEEQGIILEDDCVPSLSFFWYCEAMLNKYKDDLRVWHVSGDNFQDKNFTCDGSYYFSKFVHVWGWATWRNRWAAYDVTMDSFEAFTKQNIINSLSESNSLRKHWLNVFQLAENGSLDTWDVQWTYAVKINNGLSITPERNLVSNIGFGADATHTKSEGSNFSGLPRYNISWPLRTPVFMTDNTVADKFSISLMTEHSNFLRMILRKILRVLK